MKDELRRRIGALYPDEQAKMDHDKEAAAYYKEQRELIASQKEYAVTIKKATTWTATATIIMAIATVVMAIAMIFQVILMSKSDNNPNNQISQPSVQSQPEQNK